MRNANRVTGERGEVAEPAIAADGRFAELQPTRFARRGKFSSYPARAGISKVVDAVDRGSSTTAAQSVRERVTR